ncbi:MAG: thiamine phosphate synthase [Pseudomonadota bacterium]
MLALPDPPLLLITNRRQANLDLMTAIAAALAGGCRWISIREKDLPSDEQIALAKAIKTKAEPYGARVMIHGSACLAREAGLDAVHLPASGNVGTARALLGINSWVSLSTHNLDEACRADAAGVDAVTLSPIFQTTSKPDYGPSIDLDGLETVATAITKPVIALGGVGTTSARLCLAKGASGVAVMGEVMRSPTPAKTMVGLIRSLN